MPFALVVKGILVELTDPVKDYLRETAALLRGFDRRLFMARTVRLLGPDGQRRAERELGWNRVTLRKGTHELDSGIRCVDAFSCRGRKRAEEHRPGLLDDIRALIDAQSQIDPTFHTQRLYTRLSAAEVRRQLALQKGHVEASLPSVETIRRKMHAAGYSLRTVAKCRPKKKLPQTDAIFDRLRQENGAADASEETLRLSLDAKASVKIGLFSRGGRTWAKVQALDHDFKADAKLTPLGILLSQHGELSLYFAQSALTSDFIVDVVEMWWQGVKGRFPRVRTLLVNQDNGPENSSRRTQYVKRLAAFAATNGVKVRLACYPPYHSKYNPNERCWGALEQHWNGAVLDSIPTALRFARTMTWKGKHPLVELITKSYSKGVRLSKQEMAELEKQIERLPGLDKWFVTFSPPSSSLG